MNEVSLLQSLGQVSASETGEVFRDFIRGHVREMISEVMAVKSRSSVVPSMHRMKAISGHHFMNVAADEVVNDFISC